MSLQGPVIVVAETPVAEVTQALSVAGAFPIVETNWADAPTAFVAVKPVAVVIAEPGAPASESSARMLCLQIATAPGPIVPTVAVTRDNLEPAVPLALPADASLSLKHLVARLRSAMRVHALHAIVLRRIETFVPHAGKVPTLPVGDPLEDATVLIAGRGPLYPALSVAIGERMHMLGALSVESAARYLGARDIDGIVVGDGFSPRIIEAFLTVLAQDTQFRDIPVAVIGEAPADFADMLPNIDKVSGDPAHIVARMVPLVRMHAFEARLKRMLKSLDTDGHYDPQTSLLTRDCFFRDLNKAIADTGAHSQALSVARFSFDGIDGDRARFDRARLLTRLVRKIDFATAEDDGALLVAFTQTDLRGAHVVARRFAAGLQSAVGAAPRLHEKPATNVTLATLKAGDTLDSLMQRVMGSQVVAAE